MNSVAHCEMVDAAEELSGGQNVISNVQSAKQDWCPELGCRVNLVCGIGHDGSAKSAGPRKSYPNIARHLSRDTLPPGSTQAGHDSYRDHCDSSGSNTLMLWKFFIMDQGTEFGADFQPLCQSRGVLLVVTDWKRRGKIPSSSDTEPCSRWHSRKRAVWRPRRRSPK